VDRQRPDLQRLRQANSFGQAATLYDRARPNYPVDAIEWALAAADPPARQVADLGAGTGIMTRQLIGLGYDVLAIEPDDLMRQRLAATTPGATALAGSAEAMPLPDASLDAAIAAQSYHWFEHDTAHAEIGRAVRPGGVFAAIWNVRDESAPWVAELTAIVNGVPGKAANNHEASHFGPLFAAPELGLFEHSVTHTADTLVNLLRSRSYYLTATEEQQQDLEVRVRALAAHHPDLAGRSEFPLRYVTRVYRAIRLDHSSAAY
jgi:SAM-dependent methyltransferase